MEITCKNCQHVYEGNYCNNCSQPADTHRINRHFLWHDIQHGLFHFDKGILYSFKALFTRPGDSIREFIEGKRVNHFKPLSLVLLLAGMYGFLYHKFDLNLFPDPTESEFDYHDFNEWMATHFSWITIATIPIYTIGTWIAFRKQGYNFVEYFILNTFKASQKLFAHIATFPLLYYYYGTPHIATITNIIYALDVVLIFWSNMGFFNKMPKIKVFLLSALSHFIFWILMLIIVASVLLISGKLKT
ncbi:DUF3667 domain-containing protein [Flavobacterium sp. GA093]|uniref:DUF3667 domain-containing protein n=1 Tax=Flavobacterium hydrocarbonoxydans TaxID=2683249 RepID=A0A6I4NPJ8_9FLAO|nr:DUF3667 domain-containing protein [Flavobacterium hydrocarbonoxydans]MWB96328.1 DUF3667 domain-containing protein [Flavobacterium hydrocarbonoxydans]